MQPTQSAKRYGAWTYDLYDLLRDHIRFTGHAYVTAPLELNIDSVPDGEVKIYQHRAFLGGLNWNWIQTGKWLVLVYERTRWIVFDIDTWERGGEDVLKEIQTFLILDQL